MTNQPTDGVQVLANAIEAEQEWTLDAARLRDEILRAFTSRLDALATTAPDRLTKAIAVVVQAGPGRTVLVLSDPDLADLVTELQRYALDPETAGNPLAALLQAKVQV
ncbi:MAG: hypothetical protein ABFD89_29180 [Bryobacteraceae bacterium]